MFYIFLLQTTDFAFEIVSEKSIALYVDELMHDDGIGSCLDLINMIEKALKKINEDIFYLLFIVPNTDEIRAKVDVLVKRLHALQVSYRISNHNIKSFSAL